MSRINIHQIKKNLSYINLNANYLTISLTICKQGKRLFY